MACHGLYAYVYLKWIFKVSFFLFFFFSFLLSMLQGWAGPGCILTSVWTLAIKIQRGGGNWNHSEWCMFQDSLSIIVFPSAGSNEICCHYCAPLAEETITLLVSWSPPRLNIFAGPRFEICTVWKESGHKPWKEFSGMKAVFWLYTSPRESHRAAS